MYQYITVQNCTYTKDIAKLNPNPICISHLPEESQRADPLSLLVFV